MYLSTVRYAHSVNALIHTLTHTPKWHKHFRDGTSKMKIIKGIYRNLPHHRQRHPPPQQHHKMVKTYFCLLATFFQLPRIDTWITKTQINKLKMSVKQTGEPKERPNTVKAGKKYFENFILWKKKYFSINRLVNGVVNKCVTCVCSAKMVHKMRSKVFHSFFSPGRFNISNEAPVFLLIFRFFFFIFHSFATFEAIIRWLWITENFLLV